MTPAAVPGRGEGDTGPAGDAGAAWEILGTPFEVTTASRSLGDLVVELLAGFPAATCAAPALRRVVLVEGCGSHRHRFCAHAADAVYGFAGTGPLLSWLLTTLNRAALEAFDGLAVHAAVLARHGSAVAFPAESGTGKTTLTAAGLQAGFEYVSDEALCLAGDTGALVPYPRPLVLSAWSVHAVGLDDVHTIDLDGGEVALPPARLGAGIAAAPLTLDHVIHLSRRPGPSSLEPVARADAVAWLLRRSFNHYKRPLESFRAVTGLVSGARAWRLECGDPVEAAGLLRERLS